MKWCDNSVSTVYIGVNCEEAIIKRIKETSWTNNERNQDKW
jgi:hypothetical protein